MTRFIAINLLIYFLVSPTWAFSDIVRMNIGDSWKKNPIPVNWIGVLSGIKAESNIATFYYEIDGESFAFDVHVSRIYSIVFNDQSTMEENFPEKNLRKNPYHTPLPASQPNDRNRGILLDNQGGVAEKIPKNVKITPNRDNPEIKVYGVISYADDDIAILLLTNREGKKTPVTVDRKILLSWNRG